MGVFGNRQDAKRIRNISGMNQIMLDLKTSRNVNHVYINQEMDVTNLCKYVEKQKKDGKEITYFHVFVMAIGKILYNRPLLNRFIANHHVYEHNNVIISFVAKIAFEDTAEEMMILIKIDPHDNLDSLSQKIKDKVAAIRENKQVSKKGANSVVDILGKLPNIIRIPIVGLFKWLDKVGLLPSSLIEDNIYYSSMLVSNLGSIGCGAIFHNLTDFGTCSSVSTIGEITTKITLDEKGNKTIKKICPFGINLDERIADGFYFAKSIQMLQYIFDNPELLEGDANDQIIVNKSS